MAVSFRLQIASGTPGPGDAGTTQGIIISVTDGSTAASLPPFDLLVLSDTGAPGTVASPPAGSYSSPQTVVLTCIDPDGSGCSVYYTLDGTDPVSSGSRELYTEPVWIDRDTVLKFFAQDDSGNRSRRAQRYR